MQRVDLADMHAAALRAAAHVAGLKARAARALADALAEISAEL
jgi:hypothetical protein